MYTNTTETIKYFVCIHIKCIQIINCKQKEGKIMNKKTFERKKQKKNHTRKKCIDSPTDEKNNILFDAKGTVVTVADGALMNVDQEKRMGRLLFYYHIPSLEPFDDKYSKEHFMNRCTVEIRMDLRTISEMATLILNEISETSSPDDKSGKKEASMNKFVKQAEKTEQHLMFG